MGKMSKIKKISDSSVVCRVIQPNTFVGVAVDKDPSSVLITLNENAALKYQVCENCTKLSQPFIYNIHHDKSKNM